VEVPTRLFRAGIGLVLVFSGMATPSRGWVLEKQSNGTPVPPWPNGSVTMELQLDPTPLATPLSDGSTSWNQVATAALADWNSHLGNLQFRWVNNSTAPMAQQNGFNNVFFSSTVYGDAWGTNVVGNTLYIWSGNTRIEADVLFNSGVQFNSYRGNLQFNGSTPINDFKRVALHEFGHALCLDHPDQAGQTVAAIMNSVSSNIDDLTADDIAGAQSVYGAPAAPATAPAIASQPTSATLAYGGTSSLSVTPSGAGPFTYQWFLNGQAITGATSSSYSANAPGSYLVVVSNSVGGTTSNSAVLTAASRLVNVSSRAPVGTGANILIPGFYINGPAGSTKSVLIRASGPALTQFNVAGVLANPSLTLLDSTGKTIATNVGWSTNSNASQIASVASQVGAFSFPSGSPDCALLLSLSPGAYTFQISGVSSGTGVALAELYEVNSSDSYLMANISARIQAGTGANTLIAGFVIQGTQPAKLLIRGDGPTLGEFNVSGALAQPVLTVFDSNQKVVATNTVWGTNSNAAQIAAAATTVGAFALPANSADSALLLTLPPGAYTAQVTGANNTSGVALVEVYQSP
jgi:hypothetical protein